MTGVPVGHARAMANGGDQLDDDTAAVLNQSARLVDESRRLLRRVDRLLARRPKADVPTTPTTGERPDSAAG